MKALVTAVTILGICFSSCEKASLTHFAGNYSGKFVYTNLMSSPGSSGGPASIIFNDNTYSSTGDPDRIPAGGSGNFDVINSDKVKFQDNNLWTADFDWDLILDGEYSYTTKGDSLFLSKFIGGLKIFEYRLERIQ